MNDVVNYYNEHVDKNKKIPFPLGVPNGLVQVVICSRVSIIYL